MVRAKITQKFTTITVIDQSGYAPIMTKCEMPLRHESAMPQSSPSGLAQMDFTGSVNLQQTDDQYGDSPPGERVEEQSVGVEATVATKGGCSFNQVQNSRHREYNGREAERAGGGLVRCGCGLRRVAVLGCSLAHGRGF